MATDTLPPPPRPMSREAVINMLRTLVPCESTDPLVVDAYERSLYEWADLKGWQRDVAGFVRYWEVQAAEASGL